MFPVCIEVDCPIGRSHRSASVMSEGVFMSKWKQIVKTWRFKFRFLPTTFIFVKFKHDNVFSLTRGGHSETLVYRCSRGQFKSVSQCRHFEQNNKQRLAAIYFWGSQMSLFASAKLPVAQFTQTSTLLWWELRLWEIYLAFHDFMLRSKP